LRLREEIGKGFEDWSLGPVHKMGVRRRRITSMGCGEAPERDKKGKALRYGAELQ